MTDRRQRSGSSPAATKRAQAVPVASGASVSPGSTPVSTSNSCPCPAAHSWVATPAGSQTSANRPARLGVDLSKPVTLLSVSALGEPDLLVEIDAVAVLD